MNNLNGSVVRITTAILVASFTFLATPVLASSEVDSTQEAGKLDSTELALHPYLGDTDSAHAAYIEDTEANLGRWE